MSANKESVGKTLLVAFLVCVVCGVVVATAAVSLRPVQSKNQLLDKRMNILQAAGLYQPGVDVNTVFKSIERRFVDIDTGEYVEMPESYDQRKAAKDPQRSERLSGKEDIAGIKSQANVAEVFLARGDDGDLSRIILPVHGYGLWSTLYGFLALEPDANTVSGLGFYEHGETPGLGGEVDNPKWKALWEGKKLYGEQGEVEIQVVKGAVDSKTPNAEHKVDGLAGATLTSNGVSNLLRFWVGENGFGPYLKRMQQGEAIEQQEGDA
ncbi:MAG: Na(+)-translocating NADH-quinone reductase subunit C [Alcanivorax sp.]|jgi:Na+-transporting NADH:ubiquinone oxidoreductase subunit C|uniref:Na(+)-translocating NADH-quinone reductase subunit C n=1 Tax=Alcanivorax TaxID=59753 RepID=UPI000C5D3DDB|nr:MULTISPECIES: Na(+)-translocating NADH-quinone reductase subunit C [Alcanivorax]MAC13103.1 Na(+)-translocating NADH-quinone reductase subunit C [Alcanivorax sp.]MBG33992.1 Na(+)-translocating NADH-quinone reductase subunit C [Alcanivorax sp.]MDF1637401.1 Na(+)-translocating NADH-quinone reductase subunit C [Alcanivorax jadensis]|tara:strand:- start:663 stop:1460 length:798 start_codon:yes stop_codon:yes gene_type:complete